MKTMSCITEKTSGIRKTYKGGLGRSSVFGLDISAGSRAIRKLNCPAHLAGNAPGDICWAENTPPIAVALLRYDRSATRNRHVVV